VIALVGADGSGKSRLSEDLTEWLGWKLDVRHLYFGQPKRGMTWKLLNKPGSMARKSGAAPGAVVRWTESAKWVWLARRRRRLAADARSRAGKGVIVIAERYPLVEFHGMETPMDGPRLRPGDPLAEAEMRTYRGIPPPDLTLVLDTDVDTLRARKVDLTIEEHRAKVAAVRTLAPGEGRVVIDAALPYPEVLLLAKTAVWEAIHGRP
jgi:thymidylate kinase